MEEASEKHFNSGAKMTICLNTHVLSLAQMVHLKNVHNNEMWSYFIGGGVCSCSPASCENFVSSVVKGQRMSHQREG